MAQYDFGRKVLARSVRWSCPVGTRLAQPPACGCGTLPRGRQPAMHPQGREMEVLPMVTPIPSATHLSAESYLITEDLPLLWASLVAFREAIAPTETQV